MVDMQRCTVDVDRDARWRRMNKELCFVEMLEDDITRGSATLSLVRGQFNDTGLARGKCRIFRRSATLHTLPPPAMAPCPREPWEFWWPTGREVKILCTHDSHVFSCTNVLESDAMNSWSSSFVLWPFYIYFTKEKRGRSLTFGK